MPLEYKYLHRRIAKAILQYWSNAKSTILLCVIVSILQILNSLTSIFIAFTKKRRKKKRSLNSCLVTKWAIHPAFLRIHMTPSLPLFWANTASLRMTKICWPPLLPGRERKRFRRKYWTLSQKPSRRAWYKFLLTAQTADPTVPSSSSQTVRQHETGREEIKDYRKQAGFTNWKLSIQSLKVLFGLIGENRSLGVHLLCKSLSETKTSIRPFLEGIQLTEFRRWKTFMLCFATCTVHRRMFDWEEVIKQIKCTTDWHGTANR